MGFVIYCVLCLQFLNVEAQLSPAYDDDCWTLNTSGSDEFNDNLDKWTNPPGYTWNGGNPSVYEWNSNNAFILNGQLYLEVNEISEVRPYYESGGIVSKNLMKYGYYEIYAKLPGGYYQNQPYGEGFWPAFWTYYQYPSGNCHVIHDEIDILEPSGVEYQYANQNVVGWHDTCHKKPCTFPPDHYGTYKKQNIPFTTPFPLFWSYHKYAVEWLSDRIIFYFDDRPFYIDYDDPSLIMGPQFVAIDLQIDGSIPYPIIKTPLPDGMRVDYFRHYTIKKGLNTCNETIELADQESFDKFKHNLYQNITIGGSFLIVIDEGTSETFRATEDVVIMKNFKVPLGAGLNIIPTPCDY